MSEWPKDPSIKKGEEHMFGNKHPKPQKPQKKGSPPPKKKGEQHPMLEPPHKGGKHRRGR